MVTPGNTSLTWKVEPRQVLELTCHQKGYHYDLHLDLHRGLYRLEKVNMCKFQEVTMKNFNLPTWAS